MLEQVEIRAEELRVGDRLTEWCGPWHIGVAVGPSERVTEVVIVSGPDGADTVEAWTATGEYASVPAFSCPDWSSVTVWREVSR